MKKKKAVKEKWCPLTGHYKYFTLGHKTIIERARALWRKPGVPYRTPDGRIIPTVKPFSKEDKEKARAILYKWDALQKDHTYIWMLADNIKGAQNSGGTNCEKFLQKTVSWFKELDPTPLEVFSILAIHEGRVSENLEMALELLALTEKYTPDAMLGKKVTEGGKSGGEARRSQVREDRAPIWVDWQTQAEKIWKINPSLSKLETAKRICKAAGIGSLNTIRQKIKKAHG